MKNIKRFLALVLALTMCIATLATVSAGTLGAWYSGAVDYIESKGIDTIGTKAGLKITRNDFVYWIAKVVTHQVSDGAWDESVLKDEVTFTDVTAAHHQAAIAHSQQLGYLKGDGEGKFYPDKALTLAEASAILVRVMGYENKVTGLAADWKYNYMLVANLQCGAFDATFLAQTRTADPDYELTYGEAAYILATVMNWNGVAPTSLTADGVDLGEYFNGQTTGASTYTAVVTGLDYVVDMQTNGLINHFTDIVDLEGSVDLVVKYSDGTSEIVAIDTLSLQGYIRVSQGLSAEVDWRNEEVYDLGDYLFNGSTVTVKFDNTTNKITSIKLVDNKLVDTFAVIKSTSSDRYVPYLANTKGSVNYTMELPVGYTEDVHFSYVDVARDGLGNIVSASLKVGEKTYKISSSETTAEGALAVYDLYTTDDVLVALTTPLTAAEVYDLIPDTGRGMATFVLTDLNGDGDYDQAVATDNFEFIYRSKLNANPALSSSANEDKVYEMGAVLAGYKPSVLTSLSTDMFGLGDATNEITLIVSSSNKRWITAEGAGYLGADNPNGGHSVLLPLYYDIKLPYTLNSAYIESATALEVDGYYRVVLVNLDGTRTTAYMPIPTGTEVVKSVKDATSGATVDHPVYKIARGWTMYRLDDNFDSVKGWYAYEDNDVVKADEEIPYYDSEAGVLYDCLGTTEIAGAYPYVVYDYIPMTTDVTVTIGGLETVVTLDSSTWVPFLTDYVAENDIGVNSVTTIADTAAWMVDKYIKYALDESGKVLFALPTTKSSSEGLIVSVAKTETGDNTYNVTMGVSGVQASNDFVTAESYGDARWSYTRWGAWHTMAGASGSYGPNAYTENEKFALIGLDLEAIVFDTVVQAYMGTVANVLGYARNAVVALRDDANFDNQLIGTSTVAELRAYFAEQCGLNTAPTTMAELYLSLKDAVLEDATQSTINKLCVALLKLYIPSTTAADEAEKIGEYWTSTVSKFYPGETAPASKTALSDIFDKKTPTVTKASLNELIGEYFDINTTDAATLSKLISFTGNLDVSGLSSTAPAALKNAITIGNIFVNANNAGLLTAGSYTAVDETMTIQAILEARLPAGSIVFDKWLSAILDSSLEGYKIATAQYIYYEIQQAIDVAKGGFWTVNKATHGTYGKVYLKETLEYTGPVSLVTKEVRGAASSVEDWENYEAYHRIFQTGTLVHDLEVNEVLEGENLSYGRFYVDAGALAVLRYVGETENGEPTHFYTNTAGAWSYFYFSANSALGANWQTKGIINFNKTTVAEAASYLDLSEIITITEPVMVAGTKVATDEYNYTAKYTIKYAEDPYYLRTSTPAYTRYWKVVKTATVTGTTKPVDADPIRTYIPVVDGYNVQIPVADEDIASWEALTQDSQGVAVEYKVINNLLYKVNTVKPQYKYVNGKVATTTVYDFANPVSSTVENDVQVQPKEMKSMTKIAALSPDDDGFFPNAYSISFDGQDLITAGKTNIVVMTPDFKTGNVTGNVYTVAELAEKHLGVWATRKFVSYSGTSLTMLTVIGEVVSLDPAEEPTPSVPTDTARTVLVVSPDSVVEQLETGKNYVVKSLYSAVEIPTGDEVGSISVPYSTYVEATAAASINPVLEAETFYRIDENNVVLGKSSITWLDGVITSATADGKVSGTLNGKAIKDASLNWQFFYMDFDHTFIKKASSNTSVVVASEATAKKAVTDAQTKANSALAAYQNAVTTGLSDAKIAEYKAAYEAAAAAVITANENAVAKNLDGTFWGVENSPAFNYLVMGKLTYQANPTPITFNYVVLDGVYCVLVNSFFD